MDHRSAAGGGPKLFLDLPWHLGPTTHRRAQGHLYLDLQLLFSKCPRSHLPKLRLGIFHPVKGSEVYVFLVFSVLLRGLVILNEQMNGVR